VESLEKADAWRGWGGGAVQWPAQEGLFYGPVGLTENVWRE